MNTGHVIGRSIWHSDLDQPARANELQGILSDWSRAGLLDELERGFNDQCPVRETWRIDSLELDLGDIAFDELRRELPLRTRERLRTALAELVSERELARTYGNGSALQVLEVDAVMQEFVAWFLQRGTLPWWFKGGESALQVFDSALNARAEQITALIRGLGLAPVVRMRIVRQVGDNRVRRVIHLLEPGQGDFICGFADNLFATHAKHQVPRVAAGEYREQIWFNILTWLLLDRGSLFNTTDFVRATLWRTAQHYQLDFAAFLGQMAQAVDKLEPLGMVTKDFLAAIKSIHADVVDGVGRKESTESTGEERWDILRNMVRNAQRRHNIGPEAVDVAELFSVLAQQDAGRAARLLCAEGQSAQAVRGLLKNFDQDGLALIVAVLTPQDQPFILGYIQHAEAHARTAIPRWAANAVWEVVLTYLLTNSSTQFDRRQMITVTLRRICELHRLDFRGLLDILIHTLHERSAGIRYLGLLDIFRHLYSEETERQTTLSARQSAELPDHRQTIRRPWKDAMAQFLRDGVQKPERPGLVNFESMRVFGTLHRFDDVEPLSSVLTRPTLGAVNNDAVCRRLLLLAGPNGLARLFDLVQPGAGAFCSDLLDQLCEWRQQGQISSLHRIDFSLELPAVLLEALPKFRSDQISAGEAFDARPFWERFTSLLTQRTGTNIDLFHRQLQEILSAEGTFTGREEIAELHASNSNSECATLRRTLTPLIGSTNSKEARAFIATRDLIVRDRSNNNRSMPTEIFRALRSQLAMPVESRLPRESAEIPVQSVAALTSELASQKSQEVRLALASQPDRYELLCKLVCIDHIDWLKAAVAPHLPSTVDTGELFLKQLVRFTRNAIDWKGATAIFEHRVRAAFWEVALFTPGRNISAGRWLFAVLRNVSLRLCVPLSKWNIVAQDSSFVEIGIWREALDYLPTLYTPSGADLASPAAKKSTTKARRSSAAARKLRQDFLGHYLDHPDFAETVRQCLKHGRPPAGPRGQLPLDIGRMLFDLFTLQPTKVTAVVGNLAGQPETIFRLVRLVPLPLTFDALQLAMPDRESAEMLREFHQLIDRIAVPKTRPHERMALLFEIVFMHWLARDWRALETERILSEYLWQLACRYSLSQADLKRCFTPVLCRQSATLRRSVAKAFEDTVAPQLPREWLSGVRRSPSERRLTDAIKALRKPTGASAPIAIPNCGLVLLQSFIPVLLSRVGLTDDKSFVGEAAQRRAVHILQFLVTGQSSTAEEHLALNKVLCGLALHESVESAIDITAAEIDTCQSLLQAAIGYWDAISDSSIDGLRGNWLVRNGVLTPTSERWDLVVEKRVYDLLLARSPFSYSVIKFPWMEKAMYVTWPT
ncbi:MAG: hypothetical protein ING75_03845 [Rhodocyclaceae bacterium]|nr:hypothetical protein [Rhodocyclaceae bacterium]